LVGLNKIHGKISLVTGAEIEDFLRGLKSKPRSETERRKLCREVTEQLPAGDWDDVQFSEARGICQEGWGEMDSWPLAKVQHARLDFRLMNWR